MLLRSFLPVKPTPLAPKSGPRRANPAPKIADKELGEPPLKDSDNLPLALTAAHDPLTRLPNRAIFMDRLQVVIQRKKSHPGSDAAILFLDLDDLKLVNDGLGHEAGDSLI